MYFLPSQLPCKPNTTKSDRNKLLNSIALRDPMFLCSMSLAIAISLYFGYYIRSTWLPNTELKNILLYAIPVIPVFSYPAWLLSINISVAPKLKKICESEV